MLQFVRKIMVMLVPSYIVPIHHPNKTMLMASEYIIQLSDMAQKTVG